MADNVDETRSKSHVAADPRRIEAWLRRQERIKDNDRRQQAQFDVMFRVLKAIATGSAKEPAAVAAAVINGLSSNELRYAKSVPTSKRTVENPSGERHNFGYQPAKRAKEAPRRYMLEDIANGTVFFERVREAAANVEIESDLLDFLYTRGQHGGLSRPFWENEVRTAWAIEIVSRHSFRLLNARTLDLLFDEAAKIEFLNTIKTPKGILLLTFHGGFRTLKRKFFIEHVEAAGRGLIMRRRGAKDDAGQALFGGLRTLQGGGAVLIAPDGPEGKLMATFNVVGKQVAGGDGAAYLAAQSGCETGWFSLARENERFVPVIYKGPRKAENERFSEFKDRFYRFYSDKIESLLLGNPRNIVLGPKWVRAFCEADKQN